MQFYITLAAPIVTIDSEQANLHLPGCFRAGRRQRGRCSRPRLRL